MVCEGCQVLIASTDLRKDPPRFELHSFWFEHDVQRDIACHVELVQGAFVPNGDHCDIGISLGVSFSRCGQQYEEYTLEAFLNQLRVRLKFGELAMWTLSWDTDNLVARLKVAVVRWVIAIQAHRR